MKYYKMLYDYENDKDYINCSIGYLKETDEYIVLEGKLIKDWKPIVFEYSCSEGGVLSDYIANIYRWLIVSDRFRIHTNRLLLNAVQYLPVKIVDSTENIEICSYQTANILTIIDALDMENSQYDVYKLGEKNVISVSKYALKKLQIQEHHIFRLKNDTIPVFVSEELKAIIEENCPIGFAFMEVLVC